MEKMKHNVGMMSIAGKNRAVIAGEHGEDFLNYFKDTTDAIFNKQD